MLAYINAMLICSSDKYRVSKDIVKRSGDLLYLIENTFDRKRIYANPSFYPNSNPNTNPNPTLTLTLTLILTLKRNYTPNPNPMYFRTDEMTSFFDQVYRYRGEGNWARPILQSNVVSHC